MTPRWDHLKECCKRVVLKYLDLYDPPRPRAALFCPECEARVVNNGYSWEVEK